MSKEDKRICCICLLVAAVILVAVICSGFIRNRNQPKCRVEYVVRPGDTLYGIAQRYGVADWRRWSWAVCRENGIEGYILRPGDSIIIFVKEN